VLRIEQCQDEWGLLPNLRSLSVTISEGDDSKDWWVDAYLPRDLFMFASLHTLEELAIGMHPTAFPIAHRASTGNTLSITSLEDALAENTTFLNLRRFVCSVDRLTSHALELVAQRMPVLQELSIADLKDQAVHHGEEIGDGDLQSLARLTHLKTLSLQCLSEEFPRCSDVGAIFIAIMCMNLECIVLNGMRKVHLI
jgi:hypothetical protein